MPPLVYPLVHPKPHSYLSFFMIDNAWQWWLGILWWTHQFWIVASVERCLLPHGPSSRRFGFTGRRGWSSVLPHVGLSQIIKLSPSVRSRHLSGCVRAWRAAYRLPLLFWLLSNLPLHTKRAYLGRYLSPITLPSHVLSTDTSLANLHQHYVTHQTSFKTLHKQVEASRKTSCHPATLRADLVQLEEEKSQLKEKIAALKRKAAQEVSHVRIGSIESCRRSGNMGTFISPVWALDDVAWLLATPLFFPD